MQEDGSHSSFIFHRFISFTRAEYGSIIAVSKERYAHPFKLNITGLLLIPLAYRWSLNYTLFLT